MYSKEFPAVAESAEELSSRLKRERNARLRVRLHLMLLVRSGRVRTRLEAARYLAVHRNSVTNWLKLYEKGGIDELLRIGVGGAPAVQKTLPREVFDALRQQVEADAFPTYVAAHEWLRNVYDHNVSYRTLHSLIRDRIGARLNRRRRSND